jgi:hypothetical protein
MVRGVLTLSVSVGSSKKRKKKERKPCDCRVSFSAEEDQIRQTDESSSVVIFCVVLQFVK